MSDAINAALPAHPLPDGVGNFEDRTRGADAAEAAKQFEALMLHQLMKSMRATVPRDDEEYGFGSQMADEMFDQAVSDAAAGGLGLARVLEREFGGKSEGPAPAPVLPPIPSGIHRGGMASVPSELTDSRGRSRVGVVGMGMPHAGESPVDGVVSSKYGWRVHPIHKTRKFHEGLDIAAAEGTEIRAVQSGTVTFAGRRGGYGNTVEIRHADGTTTRYAHASRLHVRKGDHVEVGEAVADVGSTGQATGPHLHFEARREGKAVDPEAYLRKLRGKNARWHDK